MEVNLLKEVLEVLKDVQVELSDPEVAELTTLALDRKIENSIEKLELYLEHNERTRLYTRHAD